MPGMTGIDLQERLLAAGYRIPVIFITAHPDDHVRERAMKSAAVGFLVKPVDPDHLIRHLDKALKAA